MIEILVKRGAGDSPGPDISDALITSVPVALARGAAEINKQCSDRKILTVSTVLLPFTNPGGLARITTNKGRRVGQIRSFEKEYTLTQTDFMVNCQLTVEVVDE